VRLSDIASVPVSSWTDDPNGGTTQFCIKDGTQLLFGSDFSQSGGGTFYCVFESNGTEVKSNAYPVEITYLPISNNLIHAYQTILEGTTPAILTGSTPSGGT